MTKQLIIDGDCVSLSPWGEGRGEGMVFDMTVGRQTAPSPGAPRLALPRRGADLSPRGEVKWGLDHPALCADLSPRGEAKWELDKS